MLRAISAARWSEIYEVARIVCSPKKRYAFVLILKLVRECIGSEAANAGSNLTYGLWVFLGNHCICCKGSL